VSQRRKRKAGLGHLTLTKNKVVQAEIIVGGDAWIRDRVTLHCCRSVKQLYKLKARVTLLAGKSRFACVNGFIAFGRVKRVGNQLFFRSMGKESGSCFVVKC